MISHEDLLPAILCGPPLVRMGDNTPFMRYGHINLIEVRDPGLSRNGWACLDIPLEIMIAGPRIGVKVGALRMQYLPFTREKNISLEKSDGMEFMP